MSVKAVSIMIEAVNLVIETMPAFELYQGQCAYGQADAMVAGTRYRFPGWHCGAGLDF